MIIDTHVFLWYIKDSPELPENVKTLLMKQPTEVFISSISFWEMILLTERGSINFGRIDPKIYLRENLIRTGFQEIGLNSEIAMLSRTLTFTHNDPADRFIAATANYLNQPLVTYDQKLIQLPWLNTIC